MRPGINWKAVVRLMLKNQVKDAWQLSVLSMAAGLMDLCPNETIGRRKPSFKVLVMPFTCHTHQFSQSSYLRQLFTVFPLFPQPVPLSSTHHYNRSMTTAVPFL